MYYLLKIFISSLKKEMYLFFIWIFAGNRTARFDNVCQRDFVNHKLIIIFSEIVALHDDSEAALCSNPKTIFECRPIKSGFYGSWKIYWSSYLTQTEMKYFIKLGAVSDIYIAKHIKQCTTLRDKQNKWYGT